MSRLYCTAQVKVYRSEHHDGQSASWSKAAAAAAGQLLVFVDSSVVVNHGWLQPLVAKLLDNPEVSISVSIVDLSSTTQPLRVRLLAVLLSGSKLFARMCISPSSIIWSRDADALQLGR